MDVPATTGSTTRARAINFYYTALVEPLSLSSDLFPRNLSGTGTTNLSDGMRGLQEGSGAMQERIEKIMNKMPRTHSKQQVTMFKTTFVKTSTPKKMKNKPLPK